MNGTDPYSQLYFFYNIQDKDILFSSLPLEPFFGSSVNLTGEPFFVKSFAGNDTESLVKEWRACQYLKEKETRKFSFIAKTANGDPFLFDFNVLGVSMPSLSDKLILLVDVKKTLKSSTHPVKDKSASDYKKDYAEFIELAVHDLDAPLRKLSVLIDRLVSRIDPGMDMQSYITRIQACLSDMRSMIDSLSILNGLAGQEAKDDECDIEEMVHEIINELQKQLPEKKISIAISPLPRVQGDSVQYKQLFKNLLMNAIRFSKKDILPAIEIKSESVSDEEVKNFKLREDKAYFRIAVADNGIGFRQEYSEMIFNPFVRLNGKSEYPGTGMGLAICKKIVENHRGIIYAEGHESTGARFILILPQAK